MSFSKLKTLGLATIATGLAVSLMIFPKASLEASIRGMVMWWEIVFPSLLPFFIVSELLIGFGVVTVIGALLEPFMRPLFKVPGVGGFVWAMGLASGNPAGAKLTARLRLENKITKSEGERLVSFTSSANPLFIFGAVSVGFFQNPALGILLAIAHYLGNITVGIFMRFYIQDEKKPKQKPTFSRLPSMKKLLSLLHQERLQDNRTIGQLLGDAVQSSVQTLLFIGGFIILFSVFNHVLNLLGVTTLFAFIIQAVLHLLQLSKELSMPFVSGFFEMTLGTQMISQLKDVQLLEQVIIASFILAFSGLSIQAQVASILAETDIRFQPFFVARLLHGLFAAIFTALLFQPLYLKRLSHGDAPVFFDQTFQLAAMQSWEWMLSFGSLMTLISLLLFLFLKARKLLMNQ